MNIYYNSREVMFNKNHYHAPDLEEVCDIPAAVLCESQGNEFTSPTYGGQDDDFIF